jgi:hypothetical protein
MICNVSELTLRTIVNSEEVVNQKDIKPIHPKTLKKIKDNLEEFSK